MLPQPFPIPTFCQDAQTLLQSKAVLTNTDRVYVVQTLAMLLMTYVQRPSLSQCQIVAKALVDKCPFLKDDEGDGDVSRIMY